MKVATIIFFALFLVACESSDKGDTDAGKPDVAVATAVDASAAEDAGVVDAAVQADADAETD